MKTTKRFELVCWSLGFLPLVLAVAAYPFLPDLIPLHWNAAGQIDGWGTRASTFLLPVMALGLNLLFVVLPKIDPKRKNYQSFGRAYRVFRLVMNLFMLAMFIITIYSALSPNAIAVEKLTPVAVGVLFCVMGNYMPKFKHNYFIGIKTPWALASETVWRATHRLGGAVWALGGLLMVAGTFLVPAGLSEVFFVAVTLTMVLVPTVFSYLCWKKEQRGPTPPAGADGAEEESNHI